MVFSEVKYMPERSQTYLGSPSILRLGDGALVASHDYFGALRNPENECGLSSIYRSEDNGATWLPVTHIIGSFWGTLFLRGEELYHFSISREYGNIVLRRSLDGGFTWTVPTDKKHGLLFRGGPAHKNPNYHFGGATPVFFHQGRIYKSCEDLYTDGTSPEWRPDRFQAFVLSAKEDADLLNASSWTMSNKLLFDPRKVKEKRLAGEFCGWLEGNPVADPSGRLHNVMRIHLLKPNKAAILDLSDDGRELSFDYETGIVDFVGGRSKFTIRRDPATGMYFTLSSCVTDDPIPTNRNLLCLAASENLRSWKNLGPLLFDDTGLEPEQSAMLTGFQYVDWQFDGDDILYLCRTAYRGAHNFHDSNRITYHVVRNFRNRLDHKI